MVFSSLTFLYAYLPIVLFIYYISPLQCRNVVLFIVSLIFYGWSNPLYICIMLFSIIMNYMFGHWIKTYQNKAKTFLILCIICNLSLLFFFKYYTFVNNMLQSSGIHILPALSIALPIGISFYTFQAMSYPIDLYTNTITPQKSLISFGTYVTMFPQLIAGPIVRYKDIASQLTQRKYTLDRFSYGIQRFVIGLSKKVMLANTCGEIYESIEALHFSQTSVCTSWIGILCYTFQIYFDFSGYSDMAIGLGEMFGFHFLENFNYPYISKSITEFWRRWHMTLGAWFKDYIFYPVTLSKTNMKLGRWAKKHLSVHLGQAMPTAFALFFVWLANGLWHGAAWKYVAYGMYYYVLTLFGLFGKPVIHCFYEKTGIRKESRPWQLLLIIRTFILVNIGMLLFRANSLRIFAEMFESMFRKTTGNWLELGLDRHDLAVLALGALLMLMVGIVRERGICIRERIASWPMVLRWTVYAGVFCAIVLLGAYGSGYGVVDPLYANF